MQLLRLEQQYHDDLNMELQGVTFSAAVSRGNSQIPVGNVDVEEGTKKILDQVAEDELNLSKVSMSRKQRGLMEAIQVCSSFCCLFYLICEFFLVLISIFGHYSVSKSFNL